MSSAAKRIIAGLTRVLLGLIIVIPIVWMLAASLKPDDQIHAHVGSWKAFAPTPFTVENYTQASRRGAAVITLTNSIVQVVGIAAFSIVLNSLAGYAFARIRFPGRGLLFGVLLATIIIPLEAIVVPLSLTVGQLWRAPTSGFELRAWTWGALIIPFAAKAFNIFLMRQAFLSFPKALEEAAFIDGAGWWTVFWRVALPNAKHALITVVLLDFVIHWNDFLWPLVICTAEETRTVQLGLSNFFTQPPVRWGDVMAYAVIATLPVMIVFTLGQRWIVQSLAGTGIRE
jgi:multiple sugar transport system permease protein/fructooligosaccharide transport system permease protein